MLVVKQEIFRLVVCDVNVGITVSVVIRGGDTHGSAFVGANAGLIRYIGERSIAVIVIETIGVAGVVKRAGIVVGGVEVAILGIELDVAADEQVPANVAIVVEPCGTDRPALDLDSGLGGHIRECAIAVISVENSFAVASDEEISEAIIVIVSCEGGHAVDVRSDTSLISYVRECAIAVIPIKVIVWRNRGRLLQRIRMDGGFERLARRDVEIREAVVVVVEPNAAGARAFEQGSQPLRAEAVGELNSRFRGSIFETNGTWRGWLCCLREDRGAQQ